MIDQFLTYELKVAVLIAVFYIFWRLLVANETWHRLNRIVLIATAIASFVLPFCVITIHQTVEVMQPAESIPTVVADLNSATHESGIPNPLQQVEPQRSFNWLLPLTILYIIGVVVVLSRMLLSLWRLHRMRTEGEIHPLSDGYRMAVCEKVSRTRPAASLSRCTPGGTAYCPAMVQPCDVDAPCRLAHHPRVRG